MNLLYYFVVKLPKLTNDEIALGDQKIFIDTRFEEFDHRVNEGEVVHVPLKFDTPVKPGDTLYFHHNVVINGGMPFADYKDHYVVSFDPKVAVNSHAYAYRPQGTQDIVPLSGWSILEPSFEEELSNDLLHLDHLERPPRTEAMVYVDSDDLRELGVSKGDIVGFQKNRDYTFKIDGQDYFRTRTTDLLYVR